MTMIMTEAKTASTFAWRKPDDDEIPVAFEGSPVGRRRGSGARSMSPACRTCCGPDRLPAIARCRVKDG